MVHLVGPGTTTATIVYRALDDDSEWRLVPWRLVHSANLTIDQCCLGLWLHTSNDCQRDTNTLSTHIPIAAALAVSITEVPAPAGASGAPLRQPTLQYGYMFRQRN